MAPESKSHAKLLVEERTGRPVETLLRELYVGKRHSQGEIALALGISRAAVSEWLRDYGITREDRPPVDLTEATA